MKTSLRDYWEIINYNYEQIRFAEIKSSVIISVFSLVFTFAYTFDILDDDNVYIFKLNDISDYITLASIFPVIYFTFVSFVSCVKCFLPRLKKSAINSPLFFGDVAMGYTDFDSYNKDLNTLLSSDDDYKKHLSHMVYATANIAFLKFKHVNSAIRSLIKTIISLAIFLILVYTI